MSTAEQPAVSARGSGMTKDERFVIVASSTGTIFEWYDFYLYATLAPFFAALFFPPGNDTAALLSAFATYAAGFLVRPFGALVFGRLGDLVGRKYTFLVTILVMGVSTFAVGLLPTYAQVGWLAPVLLVTLRLLQGLALGGEYGGAATYVAEHARPGQRGYATSWIQTTATLGFFLSLLVIGLSRMMISSADYASWGWRLPFLVSAILLLYSIWVRLKLNELPIFTKMKEEGKGSKSPLTDSFLKYPNNKFVLLALLGATAGQGVVWYTGQFYALFFISTTQQVDYLSTYIIMGVALLLGTPFFVFFGALSDRIGRLYIILVGCLIAALSYFALFGWLAQAVNPALWDYQQKAEIHVTADPANCHFNLFPQWPGSPKGDCDDAKGFLATRGLSFVSDNVAGAKATLKVGEQTVEGFSTAKWTKALVDSGYPNFKYAEFDAFADCRAACCLAGCRHPSRKAGRHQRGAQGCRSDRVDSCRGHLDHRRAGAHRNRSRCADHGAQHGPGGHIAYQLVWRHRHRLGDGDLRDHGLRPDRGVPRGDVPHAHPLHLDVAALPHRQRLVRRAAASGRDRHGGERRQHLFRPLVPHRHRPDDRGDRVDLPARQQGSRSVARLIALIALLESPALCGAFLCRVTAVQ